MRSGGSSFWRLVLKVVCCLGLAILILIPPAWVRPAAAQEPAPPADQTEEPEEKPQERVTEEITVTATLREQKVQDVPFSVAAPTEEELRERGVDSIEGIAQSTPGFTVQNLGPGQSQVAVRGVSSGQIVRDQPGVKEQVGVYLDDSGISLSLFTPDIDLFDMSRVELLRGPQGTLFGAGSASGTLRYITNPPRLGERESVVELVANTLTDGEPGGSAKVAVNAPLGDKAALRLTAFFNSFGGFIDAVQPNLSVKEDVNSGDRFGARLALKYQPNDRLTITPRVIFQKVETDGWNREDVFNILANPYTTTRPAVDLDEREQFIQFEEPFTDEFLLTDLNIGYSFGNLTLTSITAYTDRDVLVVRDATALTASITGGSIGLPENVYTLDAPLDDATTAKVLTQELRLAGSRDRLNWVTGLFYGTMDRDYGQDLFVAGFESLTGIPTTGNFGAMRDVLYFSDLSYDLDQFALFGEATWSVNERLDLTGGLRYYDFQEDRVQTFDGIFADPGTSEGSTSADGFAPRLIASFALKEGTRLNAQVSKGFRLGGINDPLNVPLCTPQDLVTFGGRDEWEDEEVWNYEVGTKSTLGGGRGVFNVSAYYMDIENLQATVTAGSCSSRVIFNVPKARSTGIELEWAAAPSDSFDFTVSANYGKSELRSTLTSTDAAGNVQVVAGIESGNRLPTVPEFQAAATATYQWSLRDNWLGYLTGLYQYVGSRFTQIGDQAAGFGLVNLNSFGANTIGGPLTQGTFTFDPELPAYDIANLRLGFLNGRWEFAAFVNNLFDEQARLALDQERGTRARVGYLVNQPRMFGVSTRVSIR
ncbi:MAG TPA: TonB-dependent receptor [Thermoanaerobaculia bacterium]